MRRLSNDKLTWMGNGAHCHRCPSTSPRHLAAKMVENIFFSKGQVPNLEAAFQVKALDVEAVSVGPPDEGVLQIRHDLLSGELSLSGMVFFPQNDSPDCPLHAEVPLKVLDVPLSESPVSHPALALASSRASPLPLILHLHIESVKSPRSFGVFDPNV